MRNIVLVTFDSLRADHCGHLGYERDTTPNLDAMAEDGVAFTNAIAPASRTNPSMAGVMTGEPMVFQDRVSNPENSRYHLARHGTIAGELSDRGYSTGAFNPNAYASRYFGFDRGFDHFEDFLFSTERYHDLFEKHLSESGIHTIVRHFHNYLRREEAFKTWDRYIDSIEAWVREQREPFLLWVFSLDTHFPYLTPRKYRRWSNLFEQYYYNWRCKRLIGDNDPALSDAELARIVDIYDDAVRFGDVLLAELRERLERYDPVYFVFGDHGEAFGERGVYGHFQPSVYEESVHVPLVVSERIDGVEASSRPISLTRIPDLLEPFSGGPRSSTSLRDVATISDYDSHNDRNLVAARMARVKHIVSWREDEMISKETYDLTGRAVEGDAAGPEHRVYECISRVGERRVSHEREILSIRAAAKEMAR